MNEIQEIEVDVTVESEHEGFQINDLSTLGWAFKKIREYQIKQREIEAYAQTEIDRITEWRDKEAGKIGDSLDFFQSHVERYHFRKLMEDPKAKTLSTPYGKSKSRTRARSPHPVDDNTLLAHIKANGMSDFIEEKPKWGDYRKTLQVVETDDGLVAVDSNGEVVPGVIIKPEETKFSVEVAE